VKSLGTMVQQVAALAGTKDVSQWENEFIASVVQRTDGGKETGRLSDKQIAVVQRIYVKHFGDA
jgi:hypothetical protein